MISDSVQILSATDVGSFAKPGIKHKGTSIIMLGMLFTIVFVMLYGPILHVIAT